MKANEMIKVILRERGESYRELGERMGVSRGVVGVTLNKSNLTMKTLTKYLDGVGYDIVFQPKGSELVEGARRIREEQE